MFLLRIDEHFYKYVSETLLHGIRDIINVTSLSLFGNCFCLVQHISVTDCKTKQMENEANFCLQAIYFLALAQRRESLQPSQGHEEPFLHSSTFVSPRVTTGTIVPTNAYLPAEYVAVALHGHPLVACACFPCVPRASVSDVPRYVHSDLLM